MPTWRTLTGCTSRSASHQTTVHTHQSEVIDGNEKAINFYKKSGFKEEGQLKEFVFKNDKWLDVIVMGIIN